MYFYLYDAFLREKKYAATIARIESRLQTLGIHGRSDKLTILKSMKELAESAIKRGADTVVAVGDDQMVNRLMSVVANADVVLGIIPFGKSTRIAEYLGIPKGVQACDVLSARIIERIDLAKANETYFLSFLDVTPDTELFLECDGGKYHIEPIRGAHAVSVHNFGLHGRNPRDGILETVIQQVPHNAGGPRLFRKNASAVSIIPMRTMKIRSFRASLPAYADGQTVVKTPITVNVVPKKLRVIVGKNRRFI